MTLEQELIEIFAATPYPRNREILIGYYGWNDGRQHTLTEIGTRYGITRERVRQVCDKLTNRSAGAIASAPVMDRALALIAGRVPCPATQIEAELVERGLTSIGMSIENVAIGARLLGRPVGFRTVAVQSRRRGEKVKRPKGGRPTLSEGQRLATNSAGRDSRLVVLPNQAAAVPVSVDLIRKEIYFHGLSTVERIQKTVASRAGNGATAELVRQILLLMDGFCWLDESSGWFRLLGIHRHGLPKAIDKVLAVAGSVSVGQLYAALSRNRRLWKEPPPQKVLLEYCRHIPKVRIEGDQIIADSPRDWRKALTGVEAKLVSVLKAHGPVMERGAMEDLCVGDGMNRFSFHAFVSWSPVITQLGHSVYGLLGSEVPAGRVNQLITARRASRPNHRVLDRHGWTDDGQVWLRYRLSKAASTYAVITIPAALKKHVCGRFQFIDGAGAEIGTLATKDGRAWGLGAFLRKQSARIGDRIVLTLDLKKRTALVTWDERGDGRPARGEGRGARDEA